MLSLGACPRGTQASSLPRSSCPCRPLPPPRAYLASPDLEPDLRQELEPLVAAAAAGDPAAAAEVEDRFSGPLAFGTGGLRGLMAAGLRRMNKPNVRRTTLALAQVARQHVPEGTAALVGFDTRLQSDAFAQEAARVLAEAGYTVYLGGQPLPTPFLCFAMRRLGTACGGDPDRFAQPEGVQRLQSLQQPGRPGHGALGRGDRGPHGPAAPGAPGLRAGGGGHPAHPPGRAGGLPGPGAAGFARGRPCSSRPGSSTHPSTAPASPSCRSCSGAPACPCRCAPPRPSRTAPSPPRPGPTPRRSPPTRRPWRTPGAWGPK